MKLICHFQPDSPEVDLWIRDLSHLLPSAQITRWQAGAAPADYAIIWNPDKQFLTGQTKLKAMFNAGAGVDALLRQQPDVSCPLIRLEDAGMAEQMSDYVTQAVLHHYRDFGLYQNNQQAAQWQARPLQSKSSFPIGVLGLGVLGQRVAQDLAARGFPVHAWTRSQRSQGDDGIRLFHGTEQLSPFLAATQILVCLLPLTPETENILNRDTLRQLRRGAYLINVARGAHIVDEDLIAALNEGQLSGATLDVFRQEPLPSTHPFWQQPNLRLTPHISAMTLREDAVRQIVDKIERLEAGLPVGGVVNIERGY